MRVSNPSGKSHVAVCSSIVAIEGVALAACAFELPAPGSDNQIKIQITPAGEFKPADGRQMPVAAWRINAATATAVIDRFKSRGRPLVIDYEHQTLKKEDNGQLAPAAAWLRDLEWQDGKGLYGVADLTARAKELIANNEYKFFSPVFTFNRNTGDVLDIRMGAFTNDPAIDELEPLALRAAATFRLNTPEDSSMNKLLAAVIAALALPAAATEDDAVAACSGLKPKLDELVGLRKTLGVDAAATSEIALATCTATKTKADAGAAVDPAKHVPIETVTALQTQIAALTAAHNENKVDELIQQGLDDGRVLPAMESWARELGKKDIAALSAFLTAAPAIAALSGTQTGGRKPGPANESGLTHDELAVCAATGVNVEDFKKTKAKVA
jgi:phage I-like protein